MKGSELFAFLFLEVTSIQQNWLTNVRKHLSDKLKLQLLFWDLIQQRQHKKYKDTSETLIKKEICLKFTRKFK